ncbi:uncharacterized protein LOC128388892 [Panonychus citri]|uniref:uncharacterized protein LOC128388892 n=1 Tax=Panonychus citri TaxID=50023 RepID=UPI002307DFDD|nr:uncharacterized protein LOC128388892 [Panonychus citri]
MLFNKLPDDCLLMIFDYFDSLEELIQLSKVCSRWADLISLRLSKVEYLLSGGNRSDDPSKTLMINDDFPMNNNLNLTEYIPNFKIFQFENNSKQWNFEAFKKLITENPRIKGLIAPPLDPESKDLTIFDNIEMIASDVDFPFTEMPSPNRVTQFHITKTSIEFLIFFVPFTNLKRIHVETECLEEDFFPLFFGLHKNLSNLLILEFSTSSWEETHGAGYNVIDFCPALESLFLQLSTTPFRFEESKKNYNLRDLVVESPIIQDWTSLRSLLSKFPKLNHLAIRIRYEINHDNIEELVSLLPEIKLLDFRGYRNFTKKSADYLSAYSSKLGRSIVVYYNCEQEPSDWPKLGHRDERICFGFDFMKNCFFKYFDQLPYFLDH